MFSFLNPTKYLQIPVVTWQMLCVWKLCWRWLVKYLGLWEGRSSGYFVQYIYQLYILYAYHWSNHRNVFLILYFRYASCLNFVLWLICAMLLIFTQVGQKEETESKSPSTPAGLFFQHAGHRWMPFLSHSKLSPFLFVSNASMVINALSFWHYYVITF